VDAWDIKVFQHRLDDDPDETCPAEEFFVDSTDASLTFLRPVTLGGM
jgi:hypothetical protein